MKKLTTMMVMLTIAMTMFAKDIKTVVFTTSPQMHCENCENKIKGNMKFEKGVKEIETNVAEQKVTIKYDASKTSPEKLAEGFAKFNYKATVVDNNSKASCQAKTSCGGCAKKAAAASAETKKSCCGGCAKKAKAATTEAKVQGCGGCAKKAEATTAEAKAQGCGGCAAKAAKAQTADNKKDGNCCK